MAQVGLNEKRREGCKRRPKVKPRAGGVLASTGKNRANVHNVPRQKTKQNTH
jgi:hypothetical protein